MSKSLTEILARITHEGACARMTAFCATYPSYEERTVNVDFDGYPCGGTTVRVRPVADAIVHFVDWMDENNSHEEVCAMTDAQIESWIGEILDTDGMSRITLLTADAMRKRAEEAERSKRDSLERLVVSLGIDATVGTVAWFDALRMACVAANERHHGEQTAERYMTARACGQSIEGYYSDEDDLRSHTASVHAAWAWACANMPLAYGRWLETQAGVT